MHDRPVSVNDPHRMKQRPSETLCKYIQRFSQVHNKISHATDEVVIMAFTNGINELKMCEKLVVNDTVSMAMELFNLADKCAKAGEGHLFASNNPDDAPEDTKAKAKEAKRKGPTMLGVEPEQNRGRERSMPKKKRHPYCIYHDTQSHETEDCLELKVLSEDRFVRRLEHNDRGAAHGGGRGGGRWDARNGNSRREWYDQPSDNANADQAVLGVTSSSTVPLGQVCLPVTFGTCDNYHTKHIDFDVAHIGLPYNAIPGYPMLAKFIAASHHDYNILKMLSCSSIITITCKEKEKDSSLEHA
ncbi:hypothetical protein ZWY2020_033115 [Hordeum vulgare]|nr:hypothetical protein ZWY2020_033115 [Hordeum vulgare]